jgi:hypothetical protein
VKIHAVGDNRMRLISKHVQFALTGTDVKWMDPTEILEVGSWKLYKDFKVSI